jgi:hypothetical protein
MSTVTIEAPAVEVGLYPGVPAVEYHAWPGASQSRLKIMRDRSPAHLRWEMDHPSPPTPALVIGAAVHTCVLEPDLFPGLYVRGIPGDGRTKVVKEAREALAAEHPDATVLSPDDFDTCLAIRDAVAAHPNARHLLEGNAERSAVWHDPETGVLCRGRFDDIAYGLGAITDLKTSKDASPLRFRRAIYDFGYHIQGAMYVRGAKALGIEADSFGIVAVEKEPPFAVAVYQLNAAALYDGGRELDVLLRQWAECEETGTWPAYNTDIVQIDLPAYAPGQINERIGIVE